MTPASRPSDALSPRRRHVRRGILLGGLALSGLGAAHWFNIGGSIEGSALSVQDAHAAASAGTLTLIDIRRPDEWRTTGIGEGAIPLDMRDPAFEEKLLALVAGVQAPVALICARGVRSRHLASRLEGAGFTNIIDVPEGMFGSGAGPGWIAAGLPLIHA
jgi:rhodanese-related sulfurtransferase